ncbi:hypothetical protein C8N43_1927 [Litoreibacter ponti]|uniref:Uncharacterized protein n=1 Tax=Litoreibacter ponti TaxID=1510457 RepID=A0A2T6BMF7_9RHOB|nr:hypothetical protein [Litoreibacter ponti]PTX57260.1 hypothetical protein C8N43_1927 [Litoreibacter ponti]
MKRILLSLGVALSLLAGPALASEAASTSVDLGNLSPDQLDALISILSGLPRQ